MRILSDVKFAPSTVIDGVAIKSMATPPADAPTGFLYFDTTRDRLRLRVTGGWVTLSGSAFTPD